jgi:hypothetical protein
MDFQWHEKKIEEGHWSESGRATSVHNAGALGRPLLSVLRYATSRH